MVCWAVVGIAVEDGSRWSMDMLGHSGGTLYKCRFTWLGDYEAVQFDKGFSERRYRGTLFRKKTRMSCLTATKMRGQGVTTSFARARRACETSSAAQRSAAAAHVKASGRSAFITMHFTPTRPKAVV